MEQIPIQTNSADILRHGIGNARLDIGPIHPAQAAAKERSEASGKIERNIMDATYGLHMGVRSDLDKALLSEVGRLPGLPSHRVGLEILCNKDTELDPVDLGESPLLATNTTIHQAMKDRLR